MVGLTPFVIGRIEAGARSLKAVELETFARHLNTSPEALLAHGQPPDPADLTVWALERRDSAYSALYDYARSVAEAAAAYIATPTGVVLPDGDEVADVPALLDYLRATLLRPIPLPVAEVLVPVIERAVADVASGPFVEAR